MTTYIKHFAMFLFACFYLQAGYCSAQKVNMQRKTTVANLARLVSHLNGSSTLSPGDADYNGDGKVNFSDISSCVGVILGDTIVRFVDLGLPSGTLWADRNIGAELPYEHGDYFAWGELAGKSNYMTSTYFDSKGTFLPSGSSIFGTEYDVAYKMTNGVGQMPTHAQMKELIDQCEWTWCVQNGVDGMMVVGPNKNHIFLPAAGYRHDTSMSLDATYGLYWNGDVSNYKGYAELLCFVDPSVSSQGIFFSYFSRVNGHSVRAVRRM